MATQVAFSDLDTWLQAQPENTASTPYELEITGLTTSDIGSSSTSGTLGYVINNNNTKYIDLSYTQIPDSVTSMNNIFRGCTSLVSAPAIPDSVTSMTSTFYGCTSLVNAPVIPDSVTSMGSTFYNCTSLVSAPTIPDGVTSMGSTFYGCTSLVNAPVIPDSVTSMGSTFRGCTSLVSAPVIPDGVTNMTNTFYGCTALVSAPVIPNSVLNLYATFQGCTSLVNAPVIPDSVTDMRYTFYGCTSLSYKPIIPSTVTSSTDCYDGVSATEWRGTKSQAEYFVDSNNPVAIAVNSETLETICYVVYKDNLRTWDESMPSNTRDTPYGVEVIGMVAGDFTGTGGSETNPIKTGLTSFHYFDLSYTSIPSGVTRLDYAFSMTRCVKSPVLPEGLLYMPYTFVGNPLSECPTIPSTVTRMDSTFRNCQYITTPPVLPSGLTHMYDCFSYCESLLSTPDFPSSLTDIRNSFDKCSSLVTVKPLPANITEVICMFRDCTSLVDAPIIPDSVTRMDSTFENCTSLDYKPVIPSAVTISTDCYKNVTTTKWKGISSQTEICPDDCEYKLYNNDRVTVEDVFHNVDISTLSTYLAGLDANTVATAYKVYIRGLTTSNASNIKTALIANNTKYVDLSYTQLPQGTDCTDLFGLPNHGDIGCDTLVISPKLPTDATSLESTFGNCHNLKEAPIIPNTVTEMSFTFAECTSLREPAVLPNGLEFGSSTYQDSGVTKTGNLNISTLTMCYSMFAGCENLTEINSLPPNLEVMFGMFVGCTSLESLGSVSIPSTVTNMRMAFRGSGIITAPVIPEGVTDIRVAFDSCSNLLTVPYIPSTIEKASNCFNGCTSLEKIDEFLISVSSLDSSDFQDMFKNCSSLIAIGHKPQPASEWHLVYLDFDNNYVSGKIYTKNTEVTIPQTTIVKTDLRLPCLTDELMFTNIMSVSDIEDIIEGIPGQDGMLTTHYSWYKRTVIPPTGNNFVLYAKEPTKFRSNIDFGGGGGGGGGMDVVVISTSQTVTPTKDNRIIVDTTSITVTLGYGATTGVVAEVFAMEACTITYYTGANTTASLSMSAGTSAVFIYFNGWKYNGIYGAVWN